MLKVIAPHSWTHNELIIIVRTLGMRRAVLSAPMISECAWVSRTVPPP